MKKSDWILVGSLALVSLIAYIVLQFIISQSEITTGTAIVLYNNHPILEIALEDGSYQIIDDEKVININEEEFLYTVQGDNGDVVIQYKDHKVRVIDEISPKHICQIQGWSGSPLSPITCLPNSIVILIEAEKNDETPDAQT